MTHWRSVAYVESPLQLLSSIEAHNLGLLGTHTDLVVRDPNATFTGTINALKSLQLPSGIKWFGSKDTPTLPTHTLEKGSYAHVLGDPFSGQQQSGLLRHVTLGEVVILDDGLNTYAALEALAENKPMVRPGQQLSPARKALGMATTHALRKAAFSGRLTLCSAMPATERLINDLGVIDAKSVFHTFEWLTGRPAAEPPVQKALVVGSGFVADGHIRADHYLGWVTQLAAERDCLYLPHRRTQASVLESISAIPGVKVSAQDACIEMTARSLNAEHEVHLLPTTALLTLRSILAPQGTTLVAHSVPGHWWTAATDESTRAFLSRTITIFEGTHA